METWCETYFEEMSVFSTLEPMFSVEQSINKLNASGTYFFELKQIVARYFGTTITVKRIKKHLGDYTIELSFALPNLKTHSLIRNKHIANNTSMTEAIEAASQYALKNLHQTFFAMQVG